MARYHVEKDNKWNVYSTVIEDYIYKKFVSFKTHKRRCMQERINGYSKELKSLLTDTPILNVMSYEEAEERRKEGEA